MNQERLGIALRCLILSWSLTASAAAQTIGPGNGTSALPAVDEVGFALFTPYRIGADLSLGYGHTESVLKNNESHHRFGGKLAVAVTPLHWLSLSLRFDGRYDVQTGGPDDGDDGILGQSQILVRAGGEISSHWHLAGESTIHLPAGSTSENSIRGTSLDLSLLGSHLMESTPIWLTSRLGIRLDNRAEAIANADTMSRADRLALNISQSNAVLLGLAASWRYTDIEFIGEWTWDIQVGSKSSTLRQSPMRVTLGARYPLNEIFTPSILVGASPSARPSIRREGPLYAVEPLFFVTGALGVNFGYRSDRPEKDRGNTLRGRVMAEDGSPIEGIEITSDKNPSLQIESGKDGRFSLSGIEEGAYRLSFSKPGWKSQSTAIHVPQRRGDAVEITMHPTAKILKGVVRTPGGAPIPNATVFIEMGDEQDKTSTDEKGEFTFTAPRPGEVRIRVFAEGKKEYTQHLHSLAGGEVPMDIAMDPVLPEGQIKGQVRSFGGKPLRATIHIRTLDKRLRTDAEGSFVVNVPPGSYTVVISAAGHRRQKRSVRVEHNGVTVLLVELGKKR